MLDPQTLHRRACRVLPACLHTEAVIALEGDEGRALGTSERALARLLLPLRHVHRGWLGFRLAAETRDALCSRPMMFLQDATEAREGLSRHAVPIVWGPWQATGEPPRARRFMTCSRDGRARLWVLPESGILVYDWDDWRSLSAGGSERCR
ncbi:hypothetical protein [Pseudoxanthomonas sp. z9]|uniref:hypothetical protein n=1 Tax=Pseudoxanthomonas sp. z9 TaxID=2584942 RepID=UPI001142FB77|nr:hypothetical protein [Pseudoxanthomonas sp. z9]